MRLLLVEDELDLARPLAKGLQREGYAVDMAHAGDTGLELALLHDYDLAIIDINLPEMDGLTLCRQLRREKPLLLILILTARSHPLDSITGLDAGADDYVTKAFHFGELAARLRALLRRESTITDPILTFKDLRLDPASQTLWQSRQRRELTRKEFGILEYLMRHPNEVISQETLLEHIWDAHANVLTNTVRVHSSSLRIKLNDHATAPTYIETVIGSGYRLVGSANSTLP